MANIVISRIQHRRGRRENLPQPLLPAEVALTSDTGQAWMGQDPTLAVPSINIFNDKLQSTAQGIVDVNIVETRFDENMTVAIFNTLVSELKVAAGVTLVDADILWDDTYRGTIETITVAVAGAGYTTGDVITAISATGSGFIGTVTAPAGAITGVTITSGGTNFQSANTTFSIAGGTGGTLSVAVTDIYGSAVHIAANPTVDAGNTIANIGTTIDGLSATITNRLMSALTNHTAFGGTFVSNSLLVDNHIEAANVTALINRVNATTPGETTGLAFTNLNIEITGGGTSSVLGGLSDVDTSGAANDDLLFRSGGNWIDTAGALTWDGTKLTVTGTEFIVEQAAAAADVVGQGQYWVRNDTPNVAMFTDDAGTDFVLNAAGGGNIIANINTATPPTTEAVTAHLTFLDLAEDDTLATLGYTGTNDLQLKNEMHGGRVLITAQDGIGTVRTVLDANPDLRTELTGDTDVRIYTNAGTVLAINAQPTFVEINYANTGRLSTEADGIKIRGPASNDVTINQIKFNFANQTSRANFGFTGTNGQFNMSNRVAGAGMLFEAFDIGSTMRTMINADPDNSVDLYYAGGVRLGTDASGAIYVRSNGNTDTEGRQLILQHLDGTDRARIGHETTSTLVIRNEINSGTVLITAEDSGGTVRTIIDADPDALTTVVGDTELRIEVAGIEGMRFTGDTTDIIISNEANVGLTADVGSAQGNGVITSSFNVYSTVGTIGDAATLPATFPVGTRIYIKNDGVNSMDVFPASGDDAGAGTNTAVAVASGAGALFLATVVDATWTQMY